MALTRGHKRSGSQSTNTSVSLGQVSTPSSSKVVQIVTGNDNAGLVDEELPPIKQPRLMSSARPLSRGSALNGSSRFTPFTTTPVSRSRMTLAVAESQLKIAGRLASLRDEAQVVSGTFRQTLPNSENLPLETLVTNDQDFSKDSGTLTSTNSSPISISSSEFDSQDMDTPLYRLDSIDSPTQTAFHEGGGAHDTTQRNLGRMSTRKTVYREVRRQFKPFEQDTTHISTNQEAASDTYNLISVGDGHGEYELRL